MASEDVGAATDAPDPLAEICQVFEAVTDIASDGLALAAHLTDDRQYVVVNQQLRTLQQVASLAGRLIEMWTQESPAPPEVVAALEEDPGTLTCPQCDGPITLIELRDVGRCHTCEGSSDEGPAGSNDARPAPASGPGGVPAPAGPSSDDPAPPASPAPVSPGEGGAESLGEAGAWELIQAHAADPCDEESCEDACKLWAGKQLTDLDLIARACPALRAGLLELFA